MSHQSTPLISIIIAVFNGVETLQQCIDSVAGQTYSNKELIIIDGGSGDGTVELLSANNEQVSYWVSEPDKGIYNAWNKALVQANGEWICFLGADDFFWHDQVLAQMAGQLATMPPDIRVVYGTVLLLNKEGEEIYSIGEPWEQVKKSFTQKMTIPHPGTMHHASLFEQYGAFDESFRIAADYEFLLRELKSADAFFISDLVTAAMRQGGISSSPENMLLSIKELRRAHKIHGQQFPGRIWLMAVVKSYIRLFLWNFLGEKTTRKVLDLGRGLMGLPAFWTRT